MSQSTIPGGCPTEVLCSAADQFMQVRKDVMLSKLELEELETRLESLFDRSADLRSMESTLRAERCSYDTSLLWFIQTPAKTAHNSAVTKLQNQQSELLKDCLELVDELKSLATSASDNRSDDAFVAASPQAVVSRKGAKRSSSRSLRLSSATQTASVPVEQTTSHAQGRGWPRSAESFPNFVRTRPVPVDTRPPTVGGTTIVGDDEGNMFISGNGSLEGLTILPGATIYRNGMRLAGGSVAIGTRFNHQSLLISRLAGTSVSFKHLAECVLGTLVIAALGSSRPALWTWKHEEDNYGLP
ncbi:hypothetical protein BU15DRAFT_64053 [Melanogaster broomeanus]|nr:hypothetical protein BU15DRAFT_64053 [Melanogaster broomeanus]